MVAITKENSQGMKYAEEVNTTGPMGSFTMDNGPRIKCMEQDA